MAVIGKKMTKEIRPIILGITPARGGSKGIPGKNIKSIAGMPLISWTIESAKDSRLLDKYIISTEDKKITAIAKKFNVEVLNRPRSLSTDTVSTVKVLQHALKAMPCDILVLLQATSPIRRKGLIDSCIKEFLKKKYDSMATGFICKHTEFGKNNLRRQDIKGFFCDDGNVYVVKSALIKKGKLFGKKVGRKIVSRNENVDIDDNFDFNLAENILNSNKLNKSRHL